MPGWSLIDLGTLVDKWKLFFDWLSVLSLLCEAFHGQIGVGSIVFEGSGGWKGFVEAALWRLEGKLR